MINGLILMDEEKRELARHLYAVMAKILEDATEITSAGQSPHLDVSACDQYAKALQHTAQQLNTLARTLQIVCDIND